jgi:ElaB/YqjD/DUF883 family membrane-anchored ribosome-binding protein
MTSDKTEDKPAADPGRGQADEPLATEKIAAAAHAAVDIAARNLEQAERALREARMAAGEQAADAALRAQAISEDTLATVKAYINDNPLRAVGIAFAAGYLLSALLKR